MVTRIITLTATVALAAAVLFRLPPGQRMPLCIMVCLAALILAVRSLLLGKIVWALLFLGILGIFTPLRIDQFSHILVSVFDLATLALFAASPRIFRKPMLPAISGTAVTRVAIVGHSLASPNTRR